VSSTGPERPSVVDLINYFQKGKPHLLLLNDTDIALLGKCIVDITDLRALMVVLSNETAVRAGNCLLHHGLAKSQLEAIRLAGTSRRFQKRFFAGGDDYETTGLPSTVRYLDFYKAPVDTRGLALPLDRPLTNIIINNKSLHHPQLHTLGLDTCALDDTDFLTISLALAKIRSLVACT
jgi:hypothetical protein